VDGEGEYEVIGVFDGMGRLMRGIPVNKKGNKTWEVNLRGKGPGLYYIILHNGKDMKGAKVLKM